MDQEVVRKCWRKRPYPKECVKSVLLLASCIYTFSMSEGAERNIL